MKLALGTVQFGLSYGIANKNGQISRQSANDIINLARSNKIDILDTAITYGESEERLGEIGVSDFKIVTKLPALPENHLDLEQWIHSQVKNSLTKLRVNNIYSLLLHRPRQLTNNTGESFNKTLLALKKEGLIEKIGVSIYAPEELEAIFHTGLIDIVQAPLNLLDQRIVTSGWLQRLYDAGVEIHTRSAFLQGLLLMPRKTIPGEFEKWSRLWDTWHSWLLANDISASTACLHYPLSLHQVSRVVVGVDSVEHLQELIMAEQIISKAVSLPNLCSTDINLIDPSKWRL